MDYCKMNPLKFQVVCPQERRCTFTRVNLTTLVQVWVLFQFCAFAIDSSAKIITPEYMNSSA